jgi:hypothetical protein
MLHGIGKEVQEDLLNFAGIDLQTAGVLRQLDHQRNFFPVRQQSGDGLHAGYDFPLVDEGRVEPQLAPIRSRIRRENCR